MHFMGAPLYPNDIEVYINLCKRSIAKASTENIIQSLDKCSIKAWNAWVYWSTEIAGVIYIYGIFKMIFSVWFYFERNIQYLGLMFLPFKNSVKMAIFFDKVYGKIVQTMNHFDIWLMFSILVIQVSLWID